MKHPLFRHTLLVTALTAASAPLLANTSLPANTVQLEPLLVTVTTPLRMAQPLHETQAATTVITRADIERQQPESVAQLLRGHAGIEFASNGGAGSMTSLFMRGSNSNHTLVLIDGVKINNPTNGGVSWQFLPVNQIERVEIVRGPQSSIWGADAIGGVVNIITRKATTPGTAGEIRVGVGQQNTQLTDANVSAANATTRFTSALSYRESDSINATTADTSGEKDGYEHYGLRLQLEHDLNERNTLSAGYLRSQGDNLYDGCGRSLDSAPWFETTNACKQDFILQTLDLGWQHQINDQWVLSTILQRVDEDREDYFESQANGRTHTQRDQLGIKATLTTNPFSLVTGLDAQKERILEGSSFTRDSRDILGVFAQTHYRLTDAWTLSAGLRHDDDEFFGNQTTGNLGLDWQVHNAHNIGTSVSQGYRAPNLMELYGPASWGANPDLKPEESINYELFWRYQPNTGFNAEVRLFQNEIDNLISWKWTGPGMFDGQNFNINTARIRGAELATGYLLGNWQINSSLTLQDPINREDDSLLLRRAREHARIDVDYAVSNWGAGATIEGQSKRIDVDDLGNKVKLGGYSILNTRVHWNIAPNLTFRAKIDNLLDKDYEQVYQYNTQSRYVETSLTYRF